MLGGTPPSLQALRHSVQHALELMKRPAATIDAAPSQCRQTPPSPTVICQFWSLNACHRFLPGLGVSGVVAA